MTLLVGRHTPRSRLDVALVRFTATHACPVYLRTARDDLALTAALRQLIGRTCPAYLRAAAEPWLTEHSETEEH